MKSDTILRFGILLFILSLILSFFSPEEKPTLEENIFSIQLESKKQSIPKLPNFIFKNFTEKDISFNTCKNVTIRMEGKKLSEKDISESGFCKDITIPAGKIYTTTQKNKSDFTPIIGFFSQPANFSFTFNIENLEIIKNYTVTERGFISNIFNTLFYQPVYNIFVGMLQFIPGHNLGIAIILLTIFIRLILLVPQNKMIRSQKHLQEIQPKIKALQEKYKGKQQELGMKLMELYKKEGVNPMGSCLPLLIQLPLLLVLFRVIRDISKPIGSFFLYPFLANFNIGMIQEYFLWVSLYTTQGITGIGMGIILAIAQFIQMKISFSRKKKPQAPIKTTKNEFMPDPEMMQKMMTYFMPIMIGVFAFSFPLAIGLYWLVWTLFMTAQQFFIGKEKTSSKK